MVQGFVIVCAVLSGVSVDATIEIVTPDGIETRDAWAELDRDAAAIDVDGVEVVS